MLWEFVCAMRHPSPTPTIVIAFACRARSTPGPQWGPFDSGSLSLNDQPNPTKTKPVPAILVYGTPTSPTLTQASWFRAEDKEAVKAAAKELKFSVIELQTDADRALAAGAHEGVLKGSGRMIVGSVSADVYRRIEEHARKGASASDPAKAETATAITTKSPKGASADAPSKAENVAATTTKPASEQNTNIGAVSPNSPAPSHATPAAPATAKPDSATARETLRVGARVLAAYWNEKREFEGFWLATVKRIEPGGYTLEWFDSPGYPAFKSRPQDIAVPHPEFRVSGK